MARSGENVNWFKSKYKTGIKYPPNWYGTLDFAPPATVRYYDDNKGECVGNMESELPPGVTPMTTQEAIDYPREPEGNGVWWGDSLFHRWDEDVRPEEF